MVGKKGLLGAGLLAGAVALCASADAASRYHTIGGESCVGTDTYWSHARDATIRFSTLPSMQPAVGTVTCSLPRYEYDSKLRSAYISLKIPSAQPRKCLLFASYPMPQSNDVVWHARPGTSAARSDNQELLIQMSEGESPAWAYFHAECDLGPGESILGVQYGEDNIP
jgi:hypothetical protein